jgi:hypothetical protein
VKSPKEFYDHEGNGRKSSSQRVSFAKTEDVASDETGKTIIRVHGSLMVIAWMLFACIGTFTSRYMFHGFPENAGFYWFEIHQVCMSLTWILSIVSVLVQFVGLGSDPLLSEGRLEKNPHAFIGMVAIMLMFIQPFIGYLRPPPTSRKRPIFNRIHHFIGSTAALLSLLAIVSATFWGHSELSQEAQLFSLGFLAYYVLCHIAMTIANHFDSRRLIKWVHFFSVLIFIISSFNFVIRLL